MNFSDPSTTWLFLMSNLTNIHNMINISLGEIIATWTVFGLELPVVCLAIYRLYKLIKKDYIVPVFVINLLISDLIQICFRPFLYFFYLHPSVGQFAIFGIYSMGMIANIGFMMCICLERCIMITFPVWYRLHRSLKYSLYICLFIWVFSVGVVGMSWAMVTQGIITTVFLFSTISLLFPYPLAVLSFVCSWRALSRSVSVPPDEQRRILTILGLVLFNYTVLFLPSIICNMFFYSLLYSFENSEMSSINNLRAISGILVYLNPLVDCLLYVFLKKNSKCILRHK